MNADILGFSASKSVFDCPDDEIMSSKKGDLRPAVLDTKSTMIIIPSHYYNSGLDFLVDLRTMDEFHKVVVNFKNNIIYFLERVEKFCEKFGGLEEFIDYTHIFDMSLPEYEDTSLGVSEEGLLGSTIEDGYYFPIAHSEKFRNENIVHFCAEDDYDYMIYTPERIMGDMITLAYIKISELYALIKFEETGDTDYVTKNEFLLRTPLEVEYSFIDNDNEIHIVPKQTLLQIGDLEVNSCSTVWIINISNNLNSSDMYYIPLTDVVSTREEFLNTFKNMMEDIKNYGKTNCN